MIIFASNNKGKIKEIKGIFGEENVCSLQEANIEIDVIEDGKTFEENAIKKAKEIYEVIEDKEKYTAVISDDSGICVTSLNNWPGVYTHRCLEEIGRDTKDVTGEEINQYIIKKVNEQAENRDAKVVCVLAYYDGKNVISAEGNITGYITDREIGEGGFGFDKIFQIEDEEVPNFNNMTLAQLTFEEKNSISARKRAAILLKEKIDNM